MKHIIPREARNPQQRRTSNRDPTTTTTTTIRRHLAILDIFVLKCYGKYTKMSEYVSLPSRIFAISNDMVNGPIMAIISKSARLNSLHIYHQYSQLSTRYRQMNIGCGYHGSAIYRLCWGIPRFARDPIA